MVKKNEFASMLTFGLKCLESWQNKGRRNKSKTIVSKTITISKNLVSLVQKSG